MEILREISKKEEYRLSLENLYQSERNGEMVSLCPHKGRGGAHPNAHKIGMRRCVVGVTMMNMANRTDGTGNCQGKHQDDYRLRNGFDESTLQHILPYGASWYTQKFVRSSMKER